MAGKNQALLDLINEPPKVAVPEAPKPPVSATAPTPPKAPKPAAPKTERSKPAVPAAPAPVRVPAKTDAWIGAATPKPAATTGAAAKTVPARTKSAPLYSMPELPETLLVSDARTEAERAYKDAENKLKFWASRGPLTKEQTQTVEKIYGEYDAARARLLAAREKQLNYAVRAPAPSSEKPIDVSLYSPYQGPPVTADEGMALLKSQIGLTPDYDLKEEAKTSERLSKRTPGEVALDQRRVRAKLDKERQEIEAKRAEDALALAEEDARRSGLTGQQYTFSAQERQMRSADPLTYFDKDSAELEKKAAEDAIRRDRAPSAAQQKRLADANQRLEDIKNREKQQEAEAKRAAYVPNIPKFEKAHEEAAKNYFLKGASATEADRQAYLNSFTRLSKEYELAKEYAPEQEGWLSAEWNRLKEGGAGLVQLGENALDMGAYWTGKGLSYTGIGAPLGDLMQRNISDKWDAEAEAARNKAAMAAVEAERTWPNTAARLEPVRDAFQELLSRKGAMGDVTSELFDRRTKEVANVLGINNATSAAARADILARAQARARKDIFDLAAEVGANSLLDPSGLMAESGPTWEEKFAPYIDYAPTRQMKAALAGVAMFLDSDFGKAARPRRTVSESGYVSREESVPGWVLGTVLSLPDYVLTTVYENLLESSGQIKKAHTFSENVAARRDLVSERLERDEQLRMDIMSGDPNRIGAALLTIGPAAVTMAISPDTSTATRLAGKYAKKAGRGLVVTGRLLTSEANGIARKVAAANKGERVLVFKDAIGEAAKRSNEWVGKAATAAEKTVDEAKAAGRTFERILDKNEGNVEKALEEAESVEKRSVIRIRDDITARVSADPDVAAFIEATGQKGKPLTRELHKTPADVLARNLPAAKPEELAAVARGRDKYLPALERAEADSLDAFRKQAQAEPAPFEQLLETPKETATRFEDEADAATEAGRRATRAGGTPEEALDAAEAVIATSPEERVQKATNEVRLSRYLLAEEEAYGAEKAKERFRSKSARQADAEALERAREALRKAEEELRAAEEAVASAPKAAVPEEPPTVAGTRTVDEEPPTVTGTRTVSEEPPTTVSKPAEPKATAPERTAAPTAAAVEDFLSSAPPALRQAFEGAIKDLNAPAEVRALRPTLRELDQMRATAPAGYVPAVYKPESAALSLEARVYAKEGAPVVGADGTLMREVRGLSGGTEMVPAAKLETVEDLSAKVAKLEEEAAAARLLEEEPPTVAGVRSVDEEPPTVAGVRPDEATKTAPKPTPEPDEATKTAPKPTPKPDDVVLEPELPEGKILPEVRVRDVVDYQEVSSSERAAVLGSETVSGRDASRIATAESADDLVSALNQVKDEAVREHIAKEHGFQSYEDLKKAASVDVAASEKKLAEAEARVAAKREEVRKAGQYRAGLEKSAAGRKRYADALTEHRTSETALKKARDRARAVRNSKADLDAKLTEANAELAAAKPFESSKSTVKKRAAIAKAESEIPPEVGEFKPSDGYRKEEREAKEYQQKLDDDKLAPNARAKKQKTAENKFAKVEGRLAAEQAAHAAKVAAREKKLAELDEARIALVELEKKDQVRYAEATAARRQAVQKAEQALEKYKTDVADADTAVEAAKARFDAAEQVLPGIPAPAGRYAGRLPEDAKPHFEYVGDPTAGRGYANRPPMEYAKGVEAHLLGEALKRDQEALAKYVGSDGGDFAVNTADIEHVGSELPKLENGAAAPGDVYAYTVSPGEGLPYTKYTGARDPASGLPIQRGWNRQVTWTPVGERFWKWAEGVAAKHPNLPRARTVNDYFHSLLAWSDPFAKAEDVDVIRLGDEVYVADPKMARDVVGPHAQPTALTGGISTTVTGGFTGRVVGFEGGQPIVQPMEWRGGRFDDFGDAYKVDPDSLTYKERGRSRTTGVRKPLSDAEWAALRDQEKAMGLDPKNAKDRARYADRDRFVKLAPPERPAPDSFNYNPEKYPEYFGPDTLEKIKDAVSEEAPYMVSEGATADKLKSVDDHIDKLTKSAAEEEKAAEALRASINSRKALDVEVAARRPKRQELAERVVKQEANPPDRVLIQARGGPEELGRELEMIQAAIDATTVRGAGSWIQRVEAASLYRLQRIVDYVNPAGALEEKSLLGASRNAYRDYLGRTRALRNDIAQAASTSKKGAETVNVRAVEIAEKHADSFRATILQGKAEQPVIDAVLKAYAKNPAAVTKDTLDLLRNVLREWANDPESTMLDLVNGLQEVTRERIPAAELRVAQEGDVILAMGIGTQAVWYDALVDAGMRGVLVTEEEARAANSHMNELFGLGTGQGGREGASLGRQVLADRMVPSNYRKPVGTKVEPGEELLDTQARPMAKAFGGNAAGLVEREKVVEQVADVMRRAEEAVDSDAYVPRPIREAFAREMQNLIAVSNLASKKTGPADWLALKFWQQAYVVGLLTSRVNQFMMDGYGAVVQGVSEGEVRAAAKMAARSVRAHVAGHWLAVPTALAADKFIELYTGKERASGQALRDFVAYKAFTPEIHAVHVADPTVQIDLPKFQGTAEELHRIAEGYGVTEVFWAANIEEIFRSKSAELYGTWSSLGPLRGVLNKNQRYLKEAANIAATRRNISFMYSLMEQGATAQEAAAKTVRVMGNFASEIHPIERWWVDTIGPFWSYRRYAMRRAMQTMSAPFWWTRGMKAQEAAAAVASWGLDDSDEFGLHKGSMGEEFDPQYLLQVRLDLAKDFPGLDLSSQEAGEMAQERARLMHEKDPASMPYAIERYNRLYPRLQALAKEVGYEEALRQMRTDPDFKVLEGAYYAPDPVDSNLPKWARDRFAVWNQERRNQQTQAWFETRPDQQEFTLLPTDPIQSGLGEVAVFGGLAAAVASGLASVPARLAGSVVGQEPQVPQMAGMGKSDVFRALVEQPAMNVLLSRGTELDVSGKKTVLDPVFGEWLNRNGLASAETVDSPVPEGVGASYVPKKETRYYWSTDVTAPLLMLPMIATVALGANDVAKIGTQTFGGSIKPEIPSMGAAIRNAATANLGLISGSTSPARESWLAEQKFLERAQEALRDTKPKDEEMPPERRNLLALSDYAEQKNLKDIRKEMTDAATNLLGNRPLDPLLGPLPLRVLLLSTGTPAHKLNHMSNDEVVLESRKILEDKSRDQEVARALANPTLPG